MILKTAKQICICKRSNLNNASWGNIINDEDSLVFAGSHVTKFVGGSDAVHAGQASSGTAYTMIATLVQLMGEDKAFEYLKALHKNVSVNTRALAPASIKAVARGETAVSISFVHDGPGEKLAGFPVETITPLCCTGDDK